MRVLVVYCHPSQNSFTYEMTASFILGLKKAGHEVIFNDLYKINFQSDMSEAEYMREGFYDEHLALSQDVIDQQKLINQSDAIVFAYPVFWSEAPSKLVGWFQRVWTYGFAYGNKTMKDLKKTLFLVTMGGDSKEVVRQRQIDAMKEVMVHDRMNERTEECEFIVFDRMSRDYPERDLKKKDELERAYQLGLTFNDNI